MVHGIYTVHHLHALSGDSSILKNKNKNKKRKNQNGKLIRLHEIKADRKQSAKYEHTFASPLYCPYKGEAKECWGMLATAGQRLDISNISIN